MKYKLVKHSTTFDLEIQVNNLLALGWKCLGATQAIWRENFGILYIQTMIKDD